MSSKRTLLIGLGIGMLIGVGVPLVLIFGGFLSPSATPPAPSITLPKEQTPAPVAIWDLQTPSRTMSGGCRFKGTVTDATGAPIEGAEVHLRLLDEPWISANVNRVARTAADGTWSLEDLTDQAGYQIFAWAPKMAVASMDNPTCGSSVDLTMTLGAALLLSFVDTNGSPLPHVALEIAGSGIWPPRELRADNEGMLDILGLPPGIYSFTARKGDLSFSPLEPLELSAGDEIELEARLDRVDDSVIEVVDAENNRPLGAALITVIPESAPLLGRVYTADNEGRLIMEGQSLLGSTVKVSAPGFAPSLGAIVKPGARHRVALQKGLILGGTVVNEKGAPIPGAEIAVLSVDGGALPSSKGIGFLLNRSLAMKDGWPRGIPVDADTRILGPAQIPLPAVKYPKTTAAGAPDGPTDASGAFSLDGLAPGKYVLSAIHPDFFTRTPAEITLSEDGTISGTSVIKMQSGALLAVRALRVGAIAIPHAQVSVFADDGRILASGETPTDGIALFKGLPLSFRVQVEADGFVSAGKSLRGRPGKTTEVSLLLIAADRILRGRVVTHLGQPIAGATVRGRTNVRGTPQILSAVTAADGLFVIEGAIEASYAMEVEVDGQIRARLAEAATDADITLMLDPTESSAVAGASGSTPVPLIEPGGIAATVSIGGDNSTHISNNDDGSRGDNLGVVSSGDAASPAGGYTVGDSVQTRYGEADQLVVTAPPSGRGGLPISISGGPNNVVINGVQGGSEVSAAGLRAGAKLLKVDGVPITSPAQARAAVAGRIGSVVMLDVLQDGEPLSVVVQRVRSE